MNSMVGEVIENTQECVDCKTLKIKLDQSINFEPGQFVMIACEIEKDGKKKTIKRPYSLSHWCKQPANEICITFNIVPQGELSPYLYGLQKGTKLEVTGPYGVFTCKPQMESAVFIAGGTGVAPLMSMIESLIDTPTNIALVYSMRTPENMLFKEQLQTWEATNKITFKPTMTRETNDLWKGNRGRINKELLKEVITTGKEHIYICGSKDFVNNILPIVEALGIPKEQICTERW